MLPEDTTEKNPAKEPPRANMAHTTWAQLNVHKQRQPYKLGVSKVCLVTEQQQLQISQNPDQADPAVKMLHH